MADKLDFKKMDRALYLPGKKPALVQVPDMGFFYVDGAGAPEGPEYQAAIPVLYALTFTIKMSRMSGETPPGYVDYVLPPLEGLWGKSAAPGSPREHWRWTSMIRQPDFVDEATFEWALERARAKKPGLDFGRARFGRWTEGLCVQAMHTGPYATEPETIAAMHAFMDANGLEPDHQDVDTGLVRRHHEIYMGDPRKAAPEKRKTVLRLPVKKV